MNNVDIEGEAVAKLDELTSREPFLEPAIIKNDSSPIWDGEIRIYNKCRGLNGFESESFSARVPVQVKGKFTREADFPEKLIFNVKRNILTDFQKTEEQFSLLFSLKPHLRNLCIFMSFFRLCLRK